MEFSILGPLEVRRDGQPIPLGGAKQRALLAILLIHANQVISRERLAELLWVDEPPATSRHVIEVYVSQLRHVLEPKGPNHSLLDGKHGGYVLQVDANKLDASRFARMIEDASSLSPREASALLTRALDMWRGPALADLAAERFAVSEAARLNELRLHAHEQRFEAELAVGNHHGLIGELQALAELHPVRERLCGQLMLALYRSGRQAEASDVYQKTRQRLVDDVGMEPGPALQQLLKRVLQQDPALDQFDARTGASAAMPTGTVTFLMTDIEKSTSLWGSPRAAKEALRRHDQILDEQVQRNQGRLVESGREGDSVLVVFKQATDAVACAVDMQRALQTETWPEAAEIRVRMGLHTGEADLRSGHYVGAPLYRCARLMEIAHGGQVLVSRATEDLVADNLPDGASMRDLGEHRLRDISRTEHVYQLSHTDISEKFPPLNSFEWTGAELPRPLTEFVGRKPDLSRLRSLSSEARLVTLTGPGGVGKSRLAIEFARDAGDGWPDGIWWIDLTQIDHPSQVAGHVAATMHVSGAGDAVDVMASWLARKHTLLVLDNCEHVISGCRILSAQLLKRCPDVTIVATSREPIGVPGERRWPVSPLDESDALSLFDLRARFVLPDFTITVANRNDIVQICDRLDGLPLAIELAASRLAAMSEREISRQLKARFDLLADLRPDDPRHQTIQATIDWSYRLLSDEEATLYSRLSVFRGGFTVESAQSICGDSPVIEVVEALTGLVEKSMIVLDRLNDGDARYRLLEFQAAYANEKLASTAESERIRERHYQHYFLLMRANWNIDPRLETIRSRRVRRELGNVWAALAWARDHSPDLGLELASVAPFALYADLDRGRAWLRDLLDNSPQTGRPRIIATGIAAGIAFRQSDLKAHLRLAILTEKLARELGERDQLAYALHERGIAEMDLGQLEQAESTFSEALRMVEASGSAGAAIPNSEHVAEPGLGGDDSPLAELLRNDLGCTAICRGQFELARDMLLQCVANLRATRDVSSITLAAILESLASAEFGCGQVERAEEIWGEVLAIDQQHDDPRGAIGAIGGLARAASSRGDDVRALRLAGAHSRLSDEFSTRDQPWWLEQLARSQDYSRQRLGPERSEAALNEGASMSMQAAIAYALEPRSDGNNGDKLRQPARTRRGASRNDGHKKSRDAATGPAQAAAATNSERRRGGMRARDKR